MAPSPYSLRAAGASFLFAILGCGADAGRPPIQEAPLDSDGDGVVDDNDLCPAGQIGWSSSESTDGDADGCRDSDEDTDDDNDGIADGEDECPLVAGTSGGNGCPSEPSPDVIDPDTTSSDDDGDGIDDAADQCPSGATGWISSPESDFDTDGCRDSDEDSDDDNDGVADANDACLSNEPGPDVDHDGCEDGEVDSDGDGVLDHLDACDNGPPGWVSEYDEDLDRDGCRDSEEDDDDDGDGFADSVDTYPRIWNPEQLGDLDYYGCYDAAEWNIPGTFIIPEAMTALNWYDIVQVTPEYTNFINSWLANAFYLDGFTVRQPWPATQSELAGNGTFRFFVDGVGDHLLFTKVIDSDGEHHCAGTRFSVGPPPDTIYIQVQQQNALGQTCEPSHYGNFPSNVQLAMSPRIHVAIGEGALYDVDGDGIADPWFDKQLDCHLDNCPAGLDRCRPNEACQDIDWRSEAGPGYNAELGGVTYAAVVPRLAAPARIRIGLRDFNVASVQMDFSTDPTTYHFALVQQNPCTHLRVRIWAYGTLVEDRTASLDNHFWDIGEVDTESGDFTRNGICLETSPALACVDDSDCPNEGQCGPKLWFRSREGPVDPVPFP